MSKTEHEGPLPEDVVRGVRGFKSHLPHHSWSAFLDWKCEASLEFWDAPGGSNNR